MLIKWKNNLQKKLESSARSNRVFIIPTVDGLKLLALNITLLIIGLVYANNYVLLFNFILFCLFIGSMYYTHFNLHGLSLVSAQMAPMHVNEPSKLVLNFKTKSSLGHLFLNAKFKSKNCELENPESTFSFASKEKNLRVELIISGVKRGISEINKITISTGFPFHLFKSFVYFNLNNEVVVYPKIGQINPDQFLALSEEENRSGDDFQINEYKQGDSLKRVFWKKLAQTNEWFTKSIVDNNENSVIISFTKNALNKEEKELEIESMCAALHSLHNENYKYGLDLKDFHYPPAHSNQHLKICLKILADYES